MSIKNRLHKLELTMRTGGAFCVCRDAINNVEMWQADLSLESNSSEPHLTGESVPDVCPACRKPIEKRKIILQLCDGTTKDRFPDEWKANRNK
jgi:hypothetical protein